MKEQVENLLYECSRICSGRDAVEVRRVEKQVKELLPFLTDKIHVIACNNALFESLTILKKDNEALECLNHLLELDQRYEHRYHYLQEMALCYMRLGRYNEGFLTFQKALDLAQEKKDYWKMADTSRYLAQYHYEEVDFIKSMEYLSDAMDYAWKAHNLPMISEAHLKMAIIFYRMKKYNLALESLREAENLALDGRDILFAYRAAVKRCKVYMELGDTTKVAEIIDTLFDLDEPSNFKKNGNTCQ